MITLTTNVPEVQAALRRLTEEQLPFALSQALNDSGAAASEAVTRAMERQLDRPTPFTKRAVYQSRATKHRLFTDVGLRPIQSGYLQYVIRGGVRTPKGKALVLPVGTPLNQYGNMPRGAVKRLIGRSDTFVASRSDARTRHLPPGIYRRKRVKGAKTKPTLLVAFEAQAVYRPQFDFYRIAEVAGLIVFETALDRRLRAAIATAR